MELFLIRHAQSQNNALPEEQRVEDPGLTEIGDQQVRRLAAWVPEELRLTRIITSPFRRALLTAQGIQAATGLTPEVRVDLHEQGGCYSGHVPGTEIGRPGMTRAEIEREFPGFSVHPEIDGHGWWRGRPYETNDQAYLRAERLLRQTCEEFGHTSERIAYVMHADFKRLLLMHVATGYLAVAYNASVTHLVVTPTETQVERFNQVPHLPEHLRTR